MGNYGTAVLDIAADDNPRHAYLRVTSHFDGSTALHIADAGGRGFTVLWIFTWLPAEPIWTDLQPQGHATKMKGPRQYGKSM